MVWSGVDVRTLNYGSHFQLCGIVLIRSYVYVCMHIPQVKCAIHQIQKKMHKIKDRKTRHAHTLYNTSPNKAIVVKCSILRSLACSSDTLSMTSIRCIWTAAAATKSRARNLLISLFRSRQNKNQMNKLMSCPVLYVNSLSGWY